MAISIAICTCTYLGLFWSIYMNVPTYLLALHDFRPSFHHPPFLPNFFFPINFHIFFLFLFYFFPIFPLSAQLTSKAGWLTLFWAIGSLCLWFNYFCLVWNWTHLAKKKFSQSKTRCRKVFSTKSISFPLSWKIGRHSGLNIRICKKNPQFPKDINLSCFKANFMKNLAQ